MLVRAKKTNDIRDYGPMTRLTKGQLYVVYAIEKGRGDHGQDNYAVFPFNLDKSFLSQVEVDPLYFESDNFDVVIDLISKDWVTKTVSVAQGNVTISSFEEWFEDGFYIRAHDWDLKGDDYKIMDQYLNKYENVYRELYPRGKTAHDAQV